MERAKKPPLGPIPRFINEERRINELKRALGRYFNANYPIPQEFIDEYNELVNRLPEEDSDEIKLPRCEL